MIDGIIMQGTTPEQIYELPFPASDIEKVSITYRQKGVNVIVKGKEDCTFEGNQIKVSLTQEDTLSLEVGIVLVQIKVKALGEVTGSAEYRLSVREIFDKGVF